MSLLMSLLIAGVRLAIILFSKNLILLNKLLVLRKMTDKKCEIYIVVK